MTNRVLALALLAALALPAAATTKKSAHHPVRHPPAPVEAPLPAATDAQTAAAGMVYYGAYGCEFKQSINVQQDPKAQGYVDLAFGKAHYTMKPVLSSTGAIRLEDVKGRTLLVQIANKSMLMDVVAGHRLVDDCVSDQQAAFVKAAENQPKAADALDLMESPQASR